MVGKFKRTFENFKQPPVMQVEHVYLFEPNPASYMGSSETFGSPRLLWLSFGWLEIDFVFMANILPNVNHDVKDDGFAWLHIMMDLLGLV